MIVCHEYRFIFIKTPKTAGTSMEIALSKFCGPQDIITPIYPSEDEQLRRDLGFRGPQNTLIPLARYDLRDWWGLLTQRKRTYFFNHMKARHIRRLVGRKVWDSYYTFAIDRNPWDAALSRYHWDMRDVGNPPSFSEYLVSERRPKLFSNFRYYGFRGAVIVDHVMRYENLDAELDQLQKTLRLPEKPVMPRVKAGVRSDRRRYSEVMGPAERDVIARECAREIALFGYRFEPEAAGAPAAPRAV